MSWTDVESWIREHLPALHATLLPPSATQDITAAGRTIGHPLPADLAAWWRVFGGIGEKTLLWDLVPGYWQPEGLAEALRDREMIMEVRNDLFDSSPEAALREPAGTPNGELWLPAWVPVATNLGGSHLFVDLRDGPLHGCVMAWDNVEGADGGPLYADVTALLDFTSRALWGHTEHRVVVKDDYFEWE
ncbi:SMI1/KNR4 family protein [Lentzea sp. NPDC059081]|uniref:SMI1/KNR4 family protein n=1 Tax=Lentzea sp. NPDC059081 TaxID=3346719 RepID=UPI0036A11E10